MDALRKHACTLLIGIGLASLSTHSATATDWPTSRGNPQRTGNVDGKSGPQSPRVLWVYESQEHFIAPPVAADNTLFVSGLGAFTTASFHALTTADTAPQRELWSKRPPYLTLPVVCAPATVGGKVIIGDGMHQTNGATLYCMAADLGRPLWQYHVPGALVHLEGAPTVTGDHVYIGGGAAGVLCLDLNQLTLDGQSMDLATAQARIDAKWKELTARYEQEKKRDPDFAVPPSEDALPKPTPRLRWQAGQDKWHVDSPVAVTQNRVLVASAKLDAKDNFAGDRALICLDAGSGAIKWHTPLDLNPWSGPTVAGHVVLVGCSSIRYEPKEAASAQGEMAAADIESGKILWRKSVAGGVIAPVAAAGDLAISAATDGSLRAWSIKDGQEKWRYNAQAPFFAGPAIAGQMVYAADLSSVVHAVNLATGKPEWKLDLATDPAVKAPGMVFGSPIVHDKRLYVATCNQESNADQQRTVVVCIGDR